MQLFLENYNIVATCGIKRKGTKTLICTFALKSEALIYLDQLNELFKNDPSVKYEIIDI